MSVRVVLASGNAGKIAEIQDLAAKIPGLTIVGLSQADTLSGEAIGDIPETGLTFAENAILKAETVAAATGMPALADDSGLAVDVLHGAPGVFSARWSGVHGDDAANMRVLLGQMSDVPAGFRAAGFQCVVALAVPGRSTVTASGALRGSLTFAPLGSNGFGYDPVLRLEDGRTVAELLPHEKQQISHRAEAFAAILPELQALTN